MRRFPNAIVNSGKVERKDNIALAGNSTKSVLLAVIANSLLTAIKFTAFLFSGSGAMLSEAIHSFADSANQGLLYLGIRRSQRPADARYHYGYGGERFFFAFMSAVGIFVLGCGVTVYHGVHGLLDPVSIEFSLLTVVVLVISFVVEGIIFIVALKEVYAQKGNLSFVHFLRTSTDPTLLAVLFEDFIAMLGVVVAMVGIGLSYWTGNVVFDSISSIIIGCLLGAMAIWLGLRNRQLLLGPAIPRTIQNDIVAFLEAQPSVDKVRLVRTRIVGAEKFRIAVEIDYNGFFLGEQEASWVTAQLQTKNPNSDYSRFSAEFGERIVTSLGQEVDHLEGLLLQKFPQLKHVDIEAD